MFRAGLSRRRNFIVYHRLHVDKSMANTPGCDVRLVPNKPNLHESIT
jgi:hypothetical protein